MNLPRSMMRYKPQRAQLDAAVRKQLITQAVRYPCYGYLMLHALLRQEGLVVNRKRTYRLYCEEKLQVPRHGGRICCAREYRCRCHNSAMNAGLWISYQTRSSMAAGSGYSVS